MKLVVLTNRGSHYGKGLLASLHREGVPLHAVVVLRQPLRYHWRLFRSVRRRLGLREALYFTWKRLRPSLAPEDGPMHSGDYAAFGAPVAMARGTNDPETRMILKDLAPDVILLGQTGILRADTIRTARRGVLNAHPGVLPGYRGIDCARWAIYHEDWGQIGVSVHWVDQGVDTGPVISARRYEIVPGETLDSLDRALERLCLCALTEVAREASRGKVPAGEPQPPGSGVQFYKMPRQEERLAETKLRVFAAGRGG